MKVQFYGFVFIILLSCCISSQERKGISKISMANGYCHGTCPFNAIEVDSNLNLKYFGGLYASPKGYYKGRLTTENWKKLNNYIGQLNMDKSDSINQYTYDVQQIEFIIYKNGIRKHIVSQIDSLPTELKLAYKLLNNSVKVENLRKSSDSLDFETRIQYDYRRKVLTPKFSPKLKVNN